MGKLVEIDGDLLAVDTQYIAHQCNCVTTHGKGLSAALFRRFPWADTYSGRQQSSRPGTIEVFGDGRERRFVINMYAQYRPGRPNRRDETAAMRLQWFRDCLTQTGGLAGLREVAFPYLIGCGLAGGNWDDYYTALKDWAEAGPAERVLLVRKE